MELIYDPKLWRKIIGIKSKEGALELIKLLQENYKVYKSIESNERYYRGGEDMKANFRSLLGIKEDDN